LLLVHRVIAIVLVLELFATPTPLLVPISVAAVARTLPLVAKLIVALATTVSPKSTTFAVEATLIALLTSVAPIPIVASIATSITPVVEGSSCRVGVSHGTAAASLRCSI
jgi:hypothetical protein